MAKVHTTLSLSPELLTEAKSRGFNLSELLSEVLKNKLVAKKSDLPDAFLSIKCSMCKHEVTEGYFCKLKQIVLCSDCAENYPMALCAPGVVNHEHIFFSFPQTKNITELPLPLKPEAD